MQDPLLEFAKEDIAVGISDISFAGMLVGLDEFWMTTPIGGGDFDVA